jgi:hypothetical protein
MKRFTHLFLAASVAGAITVGVAPSQVKEEAVMFAGLWQLARPPKAMTRDFYFGERQWLADARSMAAALQFLWDSGRHGGVVHGGVAPGLMAGQPEELLTHENGSSNRPALQLPSAADPT